MQVRRSVECCALFVGDDFDIVTTRASRANERKILVQFVSETLDVLRAEESLEIFFTVCSLSLFLAGTFFFKKKMFMNFFLRPEKYHQFICLHKLWWWWWHFPRLRGFWGECSTVHSPPAFFFFF